MSSPLIKVHWLNESRAFRVLWLLDYLKLDYEIISYKRDANYRAPPELKSIHPLGRAPIVEIIKQETGKTRILAESGYIFQYILQHFDKEKVLTPDDPELYEELQYYLHYVEGSLQPPLMIEFLLSMVKKAPIPFPISYLAGKITDKISEKYSRGELKNQLDFIETQITKNGGYLIGNKLSGADILISFPLKMAFVRGFAKAEEYPNIQDFNERLAAMESYKISLNKASDHGGKF